MRRLKVFATQEEIKMLKDLLNAPYIAFGGVEPPDVQKRTHEIALKHGLPEIPGYYGCDLSTGEFVSADDEVARFG
jgi:hypothetical protein